MAMLHGDTKLAPWWEKKKSADHQSNYDTPSGYQQHISTAVGGICLSLITHVLRPISVQQLSSQSGPKL